MPDSPHDQIYGIGPHFPSLLEFDWEDCRDQLSYQLDGLVPFNGDGHWHLCFDYRITPSSPAVIYVDIECDRETVIAPSFEAYLSMLEVDVSDDDYVLPRVSNIEVLMAGLAMRLNLELSPPDTFAHGYPVYRARAKGEGNPEWIWISPNTVRKGFVRANNERYAELQDLMPENVSRYPELPPSSYLLTMTDRVRSSILSACKEQGIDVHSLSDFVRKEP